MYRILLPLLVTVLPNQDTCALLRAIQKKKKEGQWGNRSKRKKGSQRKTEKKGRKEGGREEKKPARKKAFRTGLVLELCFYSLIR